MTLQQTLSNHSDREQSQESSGSYSAKSNPDAEHAAQSLDNEN